MSAFDWNGLWMGVVAVAMLGLMTGGTLYGCQRAGDQYYDLAEKCIKAGGSWVPTSNGGYGAVCVNARPS